MKHPLRALFERMEEYERTLDLSLYQDDSANIWPLLKLSIYQSYTLRYLNKNSLYDRIKKKIAKKKKKKDLQSYHDLPVRKINKDVKEIWVSYASNRNMFADRYNKFIDPYFHYLADDSAIMVELGSPEPSSSYPHPIFKDSEIYNLDFELSRIRKKLSLTKPQKAAMLSFIQVKSKFSLTKLKKVFPELNVYSAVYEYEIFKYNFRLYQEFFSRYKSLKKVYLSSYYFADRLGMMAAADKFGIECIDIQHGVQSSGHYAYAGWTYNLIDDFTSMPKGFLVYTEKEKERLDKELKNPDKVRIVGNLSYKFWKEKRRVNGNLNDKKKYILYSLQNQLPESTHFIWKQLKEISEKNIQILFRLHPGYQDLAEELRKVLALNEITLFSIDTEEDIYDSLNDCLFHITQFSSSTLDALLLNKTTILIDPRGKEIFSELLEKEDKIIFQNNESDFRNCIKHILGE